MFRCDGKDILLSFSFGVLIVTLVPGMVYAADWSLGTDSRLSTKYTENLLLSENSSEAVLGKYVELGGFLGSETPLNLFRFAPNVSLARYSSMSELDNEVSAINMSSRHNGENYNASLFLNWKKDTTLTSEFDDTGLTQVRKDRELRGIHPSINYDIAERVAINLGFDYTDVAYRDAQSVGLVGYKYKLAKGTMNIRLRERQSLSTSIYGSQLNAPEIDNVVTDLGLQASYQNTFYPKTYGLFTVGMHQVDSETKHGGLKNQSIKKGFLGEISISQNRDISSWKMSLKRTVEPSGTGLLLQDDKFEIDYSRRFTPFVTGKVGGLYLQNRSIQANKEFDSRRYSRLTARVLWRALRRWELSMQYGYKWQEFSSAQNGVDSNEVGFSVSYRLDRKSH